MGPFSTTGLKTIDLNKVFRKWRWRLLIAGAAILAGTLLFVMAKANNEFSLAVMTPRQIAFSFDDTENAVLSTRSLNKYEYDKLALFLLDRNLFSRYLEKAPGRRQAEPDRLYDLRAVILPQYAIDFGNAAVRNETLQFLLLKMDPRAGLPAEVIKEFILNFFQNYYLLHVFQDYYNNLQKIRINALNSQSLILGRIEDISLKIARLREHGRKYAAAAIGRNDFMLQVSAENERYLDMRQQLAANDILLSDNQIALEMNRKKIADLERMIRAVDHICREYLGDFSRDPDLARKRLLKMQADAPEPGLSRKFERLVAIFDVMESNFKFFSGDPLIFKDRYLFFKALALFFFAFGLLLLGVLALEYRRCDRT